MKKLDKNGNVKVTLLKRLTNVIVCFKNSFKLCSIMIYYRLTKKVPTKLDFNILSQSKTLDLLSTSNKSIIRFGDGEFLLISGLDIGFQKYSDELKNDFLKILNDEDNRLLVGLHSCVNLHDSEIEESGWRIGAIRVIKILLPFVIKNKNRLFGDAVVFYAYNKNYFNVTRLVENKEIVIFANELIVKEVFIQNLFSEASKIYTIIVDKKHSYEKKDIYLNEFYTLVKNKNKNNLRILLGGGPGSKVIGYTLIKDDYVCYDLGNWFDGVLGGRKVGTKQL